MLPLSPSQTSSAIESTTFGAYAPIKSKLGQRTLKIIAIGAAVSIVIGGTGIAVGLALSSPFILIASIVCTLAAAIILALAILLAKRKSKLRIKAVKTNPQPTLTPLDKLKNAVLEKQTSHTDQKKLTDTLTSICNYIELHKTEWKQQVEQTGTNLYIPSSPKLLRSVQYNTDHTILIHFNKKKESDLVLGKGSYKVVKLALNYDTGEWLASAGLEKDNASGEIKALKLAQQKQPKYLIQSKYVVNYTNKKGKGKVRILTPFYSKGDLDTLIKNKTLTLAEKRKFTRQLVEGITDLHSKDLLHRDLKPHNVFVDENDLCVGDLGTLCENDDTAKRVVHCTTSWYVSPEYAKAQTKRISSRTEYDRVLKTCHTHKNHKKSQDCIAHTERKKAYSKQSKFIESTTKKHDVWSLGCILYQLNFTNQLPWTISGDESTVFQLLRNLNEDWFIEPTEKDSLEHLIWEMLRINPAQRISSEELRAKLDTSPALKLESQ